MSTENSLEQILKRVEQGMSTCYDADWLRRYYLALQDEVQAYAKELKAAQAKIEKGAKNETKS